MQRTKSEGRVRELTLTAAWQGFAFSGVALVLSLWYTDAGGWLQRIHSLQVHHHIFPQLALNLHVISISAAGTHKLHYSERAACKAATSRRCWRPTSAVCEKAKRLDNWPCAHSTCGSADHAEDDHSQTCCALCAHKPWQLSQRAHSEIGFDTQAAVGWHPKSKSE